MCSFAKCFLVSCCFVVSFYYKLARSYSAYAVNGSRKMLRMSFVIIVGIVLFVA